MSKRNQLSDQLENLFSDLATPEPGRDHSGAPTPRRAEAYAPEDDILGSFPTIPSIDPPSPDPGPEPVAWQDDSPSEAPGRWADNQGEPEPAQLPDTPRLTISRASASTLGAHDLVQTTVDQIRNRFGFCHVALYVLEETGEWAVVVAPTSDEGNQTVTETHGVPLGDDSIVGWVSAHGKPRMAFDVGQNAVHFDSSLLPGTRSELAIPLKVGDVLLGVLDVHSTEEAAFDGDDVHNLQGMADVVAISLLNARQLAEAEGRARQGKFVARVTDQMQRATSIDDVLALTLKELAQAYDLAQATVCLCTTSELHSAVIQTTTLPPSAQEAA